MNGIVNNLWDLNNEDIQSCIELACDGINVHLKDTSIEGEPDTGLNEQKTAAVIHKVMYAITEAAQNNPAVAKQLASKQAGKFRLHLQAV